MRIFIFSGGTIDPEAVERETARAVPDAVIAADRGLSFCDGHQIRPDYIVGDFDSLEDRAILEKYRTAGVPIDTYRPEKDMTDTDIAEKKAIAIGATEVVLFGATGTRLDHTLSNIYNLIKFREKGIRASIVDAHNRISMPVGQQVILEKNGREDWNISLFPFRGPVRGLTLTGFQYPLSDAVLPEGDGGLAVSNRITEEKAVISWKEGILIVMETRD